MNFEMRCKDVKGVAGIYFKNLKTGEEMVYNGDEAFHPASIIKLPVFMAVSKMEAEGRASFNDKLKITFEKRVPSCGAFNAFTDEPVVDIATLCSLMISISDNTAANAVIEYYGISALNEEFKSMGLMGTHLERLFYDDEMQKKGYNNKAVPREIGHLLSQVYYGSFVNETVSRNVLHLLLKQQCRSKIPSYIEEKCLVGNKTGEAGGITGDAAIILGESPFILVIILNETNVPEADEFIRYLSRDIFKEITDGRI